MNELYQRVREMINEEWEAVRDEKLEDFFFNNDEDIREKIRECFDQIDFEDRIQEMVYDAIEDEVESMDLPF